MKRRDKISEILTEIKLTGETDKNIFLFPEILLEASVQDNTRAVEYLLYKGCNPNYSNHMSESPLLVSRNPEILELLLSHGADVNYQDKSGSTLMHYAIYLFSNEIIELLLKHNANLHIPDCLGATVWENVQIINQSGWLFIQEWYCREIYGVLKNKLETISIHKILSNLGVELTYEQFCGITVGW